MNIESERTLDLNYRHNFRSLHNFPIIMRILTPWGTVSRKILAWHRQARLGRMRSDHHNPYMPNSIASALREQTTLRGQPTELAQNLIPYDKAQEQYRSRRFPDRNDLDGKIVCAFPERFRATTLFRGPRNRSTPYRMPDFSHFRDRNVAFWQHVVNLQLRF